MKKVDVSRKLNVYNSCDGDTQIITPENLPVEKSEQEPLEGFVDVDGIGSRGFRVKWNYNKNTQDRGVVVEELNTEGVWVPVTGIQKLSIEFDAEKTIPLVKMERIIF